MSDEDCLKRYQEILSHWNTNVSDTEKLFQEITKAYTGKKRFYHNTDHLKDLLTLSREYASVIHDRNIVDMSIFYHDIVYNPSRKDNEEKSARQAKKVLTLIGVSESHIHTVETYIRATQHHTVETPNTDLDYFIDFDLAILGAEKAVYDRYTDAIRKEYRIYPDFMYNPGRKKALVHFLERERIFKTTAFIERFEESARRNIESEIRSLS